MKKGRIFIIVFAMILVFSLTVGVAYADAVNNEMSENSGEQEQEIEEEQEMEEEQEQETEEEQEQETEEEQEQEMEEEQELENEGNNNQNRNEFKSELTGEKRQLQHEMKEKIQEKEQLQLKYEQEEDKSAAETIMEQIKVLDEEIQQIKEQIKEIMKQRLMVVKSQYTEEELNEFESVSEMIHHMYEDAHSLGVGSIVVKDNIIKFDTPPYIKGGRTVIPVRAITESLGAEIEWNADDYTVTITKDNIVIILEIGSSTVTIMEDGVKREVEIDSKAEITNNRTYVPIRFIAETFGLKVNWDGENEIIEVEDEIEDDVE